MTPERRAFINDCWLAGWTLTETVYAICGGGDRLTMREAVQVNLVYVANEAILGSADVMERGKEFDRRVK